MRPPEEPSISPTPQNPNEGGVERTVETVVIPGIGVGTVWRKKIPIFEHHRYELSIPCVGEYGMEVEFPKEVRRIVCENCHNPGVIEATGR